ncbi:hypothetical protein BCR36DRAFT_335513, partial [Piromyces finnis]
MSNRSLNSQEDNQETGKSSAWSAFSSKFSDFKQKTKNKQMELSNYAKTKGSEFAVYANQQSRNIMQKIKKEEQPVQQQEVRERYVFGVPLEYVMEYSGHEYGIPCIVYDCINELTDAIDEVGLYRIPGSTHQVEVLRDKYDFLEPVDLKGENPNTVATLLKLFLRNLPTKLVDEEHNIKLTDVIRKYCIEKPEDFTEYDELADILEEIPEWNYNLLGYICFHLKSVSDNSDLNKMTINNLGLIFCPTLKIPPAVFSVLVIHSQEVFRRFLANEEDYGNEYQENEGNISYENQESGSNITTVIVRKEQGVDDSITITDDEYRHLYKISDNDNAIDGFKAIVSSGGYSINDFYLSENEEKFDEEYPEGFAVNGNVWMSKSGDNGYIIDEKIYTDYLDAVVALNKKIPAGNEICGVDDDNDGYIDRISAYYVEPFIVNKIFTYVNGNVSIVRASVDEEGKKLYNGDHFTGLSGEVITKQDLSDSRLQIGDMAVFKYTPSGWNVIKAYEINGILTEGKENNYYQMDDTKYPDAINFSRDNVIISNRCSEFVNAHNYFGFTKNKEDLKVSLWFVDTYSGDLGAPCGFTTNDNAKIFLSMAINFANKKFSVLQASANGSDVTPGTYWVTNENYIAFKEIFEQAQNILADPDASSEVMDYQIYKLYLALHGSQDDVSAQSAGFNYEGLDNQIKLK